jgi:hypothetical protein
MRRVNQFSFVFGFLLCLPGAGCGDSSGVVPDMGTPPADSGPNIADGVSNADSEPADGLKLPDQSGPLAVQWQEAEVVAAGNDVTITFNNTRIGARDENGRLHLIWTGNKELVYGQKENSGAAFKTQKISTLNGTGQITKPTVAVAAGGAIFLAWLEGTAGNPGMRLVTAESLDYGMTWSSPIAVSAADENAVNPSLHAFGAAGSASLAFLAWGTEKNGDQHIAFSRREGATIWSQPVQLDSSGRPARDVALHCRDGFVVAAWEEENTGTEIVTATSNDGAKTFSKAESLVLDISNKGGDPSVFVVKSEEIYMAYQLKQEVHLVRSTDSGKSYTYLGALGNGLFPHVDGNSAGTIAIAWEHFKGNMKDNSIKTVGLSLSLDGWKTNQGPHAIPGSDTEFGTMLGGVSLSSQDIDVFWIRTNGDLRELMHRRAFLN